ncbi:unnamed protein product [Rotaria sordida]|uniref:G-protein coupled receptors family 1 profile domain-containing protein n=1 Tax=Rotaria sordida TaxID=392033 RepID=A0A814KGQ9_9BILA|nr:unnamed protein product [Rotaria sordida]CAF1346342.1 unnamed protein product [Rotaria sordida]CAF3729894.1 unnamed protein product [Rotaria sordida]CAF3851570.1 unnamed protein product [Rotaria sordida]
MEIFEDNKFVLHRIKFFILIILQISAIVISLLIFAFFITHRAILNILQNQALLALIIVNFVELVADLSMPISFYYLGYVKPATNGYCIWWTFFEYNLHLISELLVATISIQRHILIFQANIFHNRFKRFMFYYIPLVLCFIYPIILYIIIIILYPCDGTQWDYTSNLCGYANCYLIYNKVLGTFDWAANNGSPVVIIMLANMTLVIRVIRHKRRQRQANSWKKQRRMTIQLLTISSLYLFAWLPSLIIGVTQQLNSPSFLANIQTDYTLDFIYLIALLSPWIYLKLLPELMKWLGNLLCRGLIVHNAVRPI